MEDTMDNFLDGIAERFKIIRKESGLSQKDFAELLGLPNTTYWDWESKNKKTKDLDLLLKIADYLEDEFFISRVWFLFNEGNMRTFNEKDEEESLIQ
jgi:transcriptional regulator with XRE-family HTH domain